MPGERGPPLAPITPSVARVTFTSGDSNHSSRNSAALWVKILTSATMSFAGEVADASGQPQVIDDVDGGGRELGRSGEQQAFDDARDALELIFVCGVDFGVVFGEFGDFGERLRAVLPHEEVAAVGEDGEEGGILGVHAIAELLELQFADDALLHQAGQVGAGGDTIAGPDLFGDGAAAEELAAFEHEHLPSGARQVGGGDQAVVAAADDDHIVFGHAQLLSSLLSLCGTPPRRAAAG